MSGMNLCYMEVMSSYSFKYMVKCHTYMRASLRLSTGSEHGALVSAETGQAEVIVNSHVQLHLETATSQC